MPYTWFPSPSKQTGAKRIKIVIDTKIFKLAIIDLLSL
jgi:hypothetical protein